MKITIHGLEDDDHHDLDRRWKEILAGSIPFMGQGTLEVWCEHEAGTYRITEAEHRPAGAAEGMDAADVAPAVCGILKEAGEPVICEP